MTDFSASTSHPVYFILAGSLVTLQYSLVSVIFGSILGVVLAICKVVNIKLLRLLAYSYTSIFRGTPLMIQLTIIYLGLPLIGIKLGVFGAGIITFSLNSAAYVSEIIRAGINSVEIGQIEAAKALGIPPLFRMKDIILPQALRKILPSLVNELINLIKESALISIIGGMDLMKRAQTVANETYSYFYPMLIAAIAYYCMVLLISGGGIILEKRLAL